jgi:hypothetical protein
VEEPKAVNFRHIVDQVRSVVLVLFHEKDGKGYVDSGMPIEPGGVNLEISKEFLCKRFPKSSSIQR